MRLNWSGTVDLGGEEAAPTSSAAIARVVRSSRAGDCFLALGTAHSFSPVAVTNGLHIDTSALPSDLEIDATTCTIGSGTTYAALGRQLHERGLALAAMASLPHISVGGAISTGTHGSGDRIGTLSSAVRALEVVTPDGSIRQVTRGIDDDFSGWVVALGALGVVTRVTLDVEPAYDIAQTVRTGLDLDAVEERFDDVFSAATSVSVFTRWRAYPDGQWWLKQRTDRPAPRPELGTVASATKLHPLETLDPVHCTEQLGAPGPWHERLPHFRADFTPSSGEEIQAEYLLPREHAVEGIRRMRALATGITPLLHVTEIRTMCADDLWLSPAFGRDTVGIHFTWHKDPTIYRVLPAIEEALLPLGARPHWGKVTAASAESIVAAYPAFADFARLVADVDPRGRFTSPFLGSLLRASS